jgi:hypothetical protein
MILGILPSPFTLPYRRKGGNNLQQRPPTHLALHVVSCFGTLLNTYLLFPAQIPLLFTQIPKSHFKNGPFPNKGAPFLRSNFTREMGHFFR